MPYKLLVSQQLAELFNVLSHPLRLRILVELRSGELCVNSLRERLGVRQSSVSQHLALLKSQNLIKERRHGRFVLYRLAYRELPVWISDAIPFIVRYEDESTAINIAAQTGFTQWSLSSSLESENSAGHES